MSILQYYIEKFEYSMKILTKMIPFLGIVFFSCVEHKVYVSILTDTMSVAGIDDF